MALRLNTSEETEISYIRRFCFAFWTLWNFASIPGPGGNCEGLSLKVIKAPPRIIQISYLSPFAASAPRPVVRCAGGGPPTAGTWRHGRGIKGKSEVANLSLSGHHLSTFAERPSPHLALPQSIVSMLTSGNNGSMTSCLPTHKALCRVRALFCPVSHFHQSGASRDSAFEWRGPCSK